MSVSKKQNSMLYAKGAVEKTFGARWYIYCDRMDELGFENPPHGLKDEPVSLSK